MTGTNGRRMRLLAVLSLLVVFVAGALVGAAVERGRHDGPRGNRPPREARRGPPPMFAEGSPMAQRLKLTAAQRDSIERITERDRVRADSVFRETRRGMRARFDSTLTAMEAVLTSEQRVEWRKIRQEMQERDRQDRRERRRERRGPDGPRIHTPDGPPPDAVGGAIPRT